MRARFFPRSPLGQVALILGGLFALPAAVVWGTFWLAERSWQRYRADLVAQGEVLELEKLAPGPPPEEQNVAAIPLLSPLRHYHFDSDAGQYRWDDPAAVCELDRLCAWISSPVAPKDGAVGTGFVDLAVFLPDGATATNRSAAARLVLRRLAAEQTKLAELAAAARRSRAWFGPPGEGLSWFWGNNATRWQRWAAAFDLRAVAHLATDDSTSALTDAETALALGRSLRADPMLLAGIARARITLASLQPLWEGLAQHAWTDAQLRRWQTLLARENMVSNLLFSIRGERNLWLRQLEDLQGAFPGSTRSSWAGPDGWALPDALLAWTQLKVARHFQEQILPLFRPETGVVEVTAYAAYRRRMERSSHNLAWFFVDLIVAGQRKIPAFVARSQARLVLARVACALERCRRATGAYPETLSALTPDFLPALPPDPAGGGPLHYRREAPDSFRIYSVGLNARDDGGRAAAPSSPRPARESVSSAEGRPALPTENEADDWVWLMPPR